MAHGDENDTPGGSSREAPAREDDAAPSPGDEGKDTPTFRLPAVAPRSQDLEGTLASRLKALKSQKGNTPGRARKGTLLAFGRTLSVQEVQEVQEIQEVQEVQEVQDVQAAPDGVDDREELELLDVELELELEPALEALPLDAPFDPEEAFGERTAMLDLQELSDGIAGDARGLARDTDTDATTAEPQALPVAPQPRTPESGLSPQPAPLPLPAAPPEEFTAEKTEIFDSPFEHDPVCPRLTALKGPLAGQEFLLNRMRNGVGRATTNSVSIPDFSMSRQHFEVLKQADESFLLRDLHAANGTALNGIKISEADLFHGDRIEAGESVFQFLIPGDVPVDHRNRRLIPAASTTTLAARQRQELQHVPQKPPRSRVDTVLFGITIGATILSVPLLIMLLYSLLQAPPEQDLSAADLYFDGVAALQSRDWDRAQELFEETRRVDPDFGQVQAQIDRIQSERDAREILAQARQANESGQLRSHHIAALQTVSRDSVYQGEAASLLRLARQHQSHDVYQRAQQAFDAGDLEVAEVLLEEILQTSPQHEPSLRLLAAIREGAAPPTAEEVAAMIPTPREEEATVLLAERAERPERSPRSEQTAAVRTPRPAPTDQPDELHDPFASPSSRASSISEGTTSAGAINFTDGYNMYRAGEFSQAIQHFQSIADGGAGAVASRAVDALGAIRRFQSHLRDAEAALAAEDFPGALRLFDQAQDADEAVISSGAFRGRIDQGRAGAIAGQGLLEFRAERFAAAFEHLTRARVLHGRQSQVRELASALDGRANSLYIRAADQRMSNPSAAAALCREILTIVPPGSDLGQRARQMLDELSG